MKDKKLKKEDEVVKSLNHIFNVLCDIRSKMVYPMFITTPNGSLPVFTACQHEWTENVNSSIGGSTCMKCGLYNGAKPPYA